MVVLLRPGIVTADECHFTGAFKLHGGDVQDLNNNNNNYYYNLLMHRKKIGDFLLLLYIVHFHYGFVLYLKCVGLCSTTSVKPGPGDNAKGKGVNSLLQSRFTPFIETCQVAK